MSILIRTALLPSEQELRVQTDRTFRGSLFLILGFLVSGPVRALKEPLLKSCYLLINLFLRIHFRFLPLQIDQKKKKIVREKEGLTSMVFSPLLPLTIMDPVIFSALKVPEGWSRLFDRWGQFSKYFQPHKNNPKNIGQSMRKGWEKGTKKEQKQEEIQNNERVSIVFSYKTDSLHLRPNVTPLWPLVVPSWTPWNQCCRPWSQPR